MRIPHFVFAVCLIALPYVADAFAAPPDEKMFGKLRLVQEIDCSKDDDSNRFREFPESGVSETATVFEQKYRLLKPGAETSRYFAYRIGEGKNLVPGKPYVLSVEYPEDVSRSMFIHNGGCETVSGVATGTATGDTVFGRYVNHNPESLHYPLSGRFERWNGLFFLHDRFPEIQRPRGGGPRPLLPEDGFWVVIAVVRQELDPTSAGAAISKIRLYEVMKPDELDLKIDYPPVGLPRRSLFWREEMADGVISIGHGVAGKDETQRGIRNPVNWYEYKVRWMKFQGLNTFCKDLLEFGHNQGWDSAPHGGNAWVNQSPTPKLWEEILTMLKKYRLSVLPYYEYAGSVGQDPAVSLGVQKRAVRLDGGKNYTHISWTEKANVDLSDPETLLDFEKILDDTVLRFKNVYRTEDGGKPFLGVWLRPRPSANPVSFNERNLTDFARDANGGKAVSRDELKENKDLLEKYYGWWFGERRKFLEGVRDYLRKNVSADAVVLYTTDSSEPGYSLVSSVAGKDKKDGWKYKTSVVNDDMDTWTKILDAETYEKRFVKPAPLVDVVNGSWYLQSMLAWAEPWGAWENHHSTPPPDPENYRDTKGVMLTHTIHRKFSVSDPKSFDAFRTPDGLAVIRHYPLNEHELNVDKDEPTGYFVADMERAGPFCMMPEVYAVAYGDPRYIGYLTGNSFQRGFPQYVRAFNAAFLTLPAIPGRILLDDAENELIVREYRTEKHGNWYALCHLGSKPRTVRIELPKGDLFDCITGEKVRKDGEETLELELPPCSLRSFKTQNQTKRTGNRR